jgi:uncharacterized protein YceK
MKILLLLIVLVASGCANFGAIVRARSAETEKTNCTTYFGQSNCEVKHK